jgi:hypothetical protein
MVPFPLSARSKKAPKYLSNLLRITIRYKATIGTVFAYYITMKIYFRAGSMIGGIKPQKSSNRRSLPTRVSRTAPAQIAMKHGLTLSIFFIALLVLLAGPIACATVSSNTAAHPYTNASWDSIRADLTTPEKIDEYLHSSSIAYKTEKPNTLNHTQPPEETLSIKTGDCEDYAFLITDALTYHGYEAKIISVEARTSGGLLIHAVAIYHNPDTHQWHYIHGYRFKGLSIGVSEGFDNQEDVARYIAEKMNGKLYQYFVMPPETFRKVYDAMLN